ncbi:restriction endonuclease subunit S [Mycoplasma anserisalpingitidis]|uniref:restriction endonuclease subunit S n=1 Tax=Mycoplasma anserisalpingitidis TaxID=519450 RepID=UPI0011B10D47|nr:restriction endonuclease subunit S [Mycoplasma anserisalpingitidis]QDY88012.1 restriction endonuclease subunit S [Mycoplasma anserisalpingitidis]
MSKIWDLIKNEKVEWKTIGEVCVIRKGEYITKKHASEFGEFPVVSGGINPSYYHNKYNRDINTITIGASGINAGYVNFWDTKIFLSDAYSLEPKDNIVNKYLYHFLLSKQEDIFAMRKGAGIPHIYPADFSMIKIPIPSITTQNKIVKILDKFNIYVKELERELERRNKQYQYYNELCFNDDLLKFLSNKYGTESIVENKALNQLGVFIRGNNLTKKEIRNSGRPVVRYGELHTKYKFETDFTYSFTNNDLFKKLKKAIKNDLMIVLTSEDNDGVCKTCIWSGDYEIGISSDMCIFRGDVNPYFLNHFFSTERFLKQKERYLSGTNIIRISTDNLGKIDIPLPSIDIQNLVSEKLNKLYKISNSIYEGLPKEIKLRKLQYEYYRNKLLDFPKN